MNTAQLSRSGVVFSLLPREIFLIAPKTPDFFLFSSRAGVDPREELSSESTRVEADVNEFRITFMKALPESSVKSKDERKIRRRSQDARTPHGGVQLMG